MTYEADVFAERSNPVGSFRFGGTVMTRRECDDSTVLNALGSPAHREPTPSDSRTCCRATTPSQPQGAGGAGPIATYLGFETPSGASVRAFG